MKKADLKFIDEKNGYSFIAQCLFKANWEQDAESHNKVIKGLLRKSSGTEDFVKRYLDPDTAKKNNYYTSQCYQIMLKEYDSSRAWYYCRENLGSKCTKTWSDVGALKIGNNSFTVYFRNGKGDGETRYAILDQSEFYAHSIFYYQTAFDVHQDTYIYSYDCGNETVEEISEGSYHVYSYEGLIAIVRI